MSNLELTLIVIMVVGVIWQLLLGIGAVVLAVHGARNIKVGTGPGIVAAVAFIIFLFVR